MRFVAVNDGSNVLVVEAGLIPSSGFAVGKGKIRHIFALACLHINIDYG